MLLTEFHGQATAVIDTPATAVFAAITDVARLPLWNRRITEVLRAPSGPIREGTEWTVQMSVPPARWPSRSRVARYDPDRFRFEHASQSDDGNPSFATWRWTVTPLAAGSELAVEWSVNPRTFWRRLLFARLRRRQLPAEVAGSLAALAAHLASGDKVAR